MSVQIVKPPRVSHVWSDEAIVRLRELWAEGMQCRGIAGRLNVEFGMAITKNSIIGKAHRLKLPQRARPEPSEPKREKPKMEPKCPYDRLTIEQQALAAFEPTGDGVSLMDLEANQCRWPFGDGPFMFCGAATADGATYCAHHHAIAYRSYKGQRPDFAEMIRRRAAERRGPIVMDIVVVQEAAA